MPWIRLMLHQRVGPRLCHKKVGCQHVSFEAGLRSTAKGGLTQRHESLSFRMQILALVWQFGGATRSVDQRSDWMLTRRFWAMIWQTVQRTESCRTHQAISMFRVGSDGHDADIEKCFP